MQCVFGINVVALIDGQPKVLNLKDMLEAFILHRREVVTRRTVFELRKARERGHILEGQAVALSNIDPVIALIKASPTPAEAKESLIATAWESSAVVAMVERAGADSCRPENLDPQYGLRDGKYFLSPEQAQAILELRLHRLTGLEHEKLLAEYQEILNQIGELIRILNSAVRLMEVIREELEVIRAEYGDVRRTEILDARLDLTLGDMIPEEERVVTISHGGYAKTQPLAAYQAQRRGGKGKSATGVKDEDYIAHLLVANSHTTLLLFSSKGKVYWLKTYEIPEASRAARGRPLVNLLPLDDGEYITTMLPVDEYTEGHFIFMATAKGTVKKTPLESFSRQRSVGLIALELDEGDVLISAAITEFPEYQRGGQGVIAMVSNDRTGRLVGAVQVLDGEEIMLISDQGPLVRTRVAEVSSLGRNTQGVTLIKLANDETLVGLERVQEPSEVEGEELEGEEFEGEVIAAGDDNVDEPTL